MDSEDAGGNRAAFLSRTRYVHDKKNQRETLETLIAERYPYYEQSDVIVDTFDEPTAATVERVIVALTEYIRIHYPNNYILKSV